MENRKFMKTYAYFVFMKAESYFHVLLDCPRISLFWKRVIDYTHSNFNSETLLLNERLLIVGIEFNHPNAIDINIYDINIYAQYAIYKMYTC